MRKAEHMASLLQTLVLPHRLAVTLVDAVPRAVSALERIEQRLSTLDDLPGQVEDLARSFDRANDEIEALREALAPEVAGMRRTIAPVGRVASKLPGGKPKL